MEKKYLAEVKDGVVLKVGGPMTLLAALETLLQR